MIKVAKKNASGGKVCHLESRLQMRFVLRSSGQITFALGFRLTQDFFFKRPVWQPFSKGWPPAGPPEARPS